MHYFYRVGYLSETIFSDYCQIDPVQMRRLHRTVGFILNRGIEQVTFPEKSQMKRAWAGSLDGEYPANVSKNERKPPGWENLQLQLGSPPVSPLGVVPDCVSSPHPVSEGNEDNTIYIITRAVNPTWSTEGWACSACPSWRGSAWRGKFSGPTFQLRHLCNILGWWSVPWELVISTCSTSANIEKDFFQHEY